MSAFEVSPKHAAVLAVYACVNQLVIPAFVPSKEKYSLVANVVIELMKENMRSIECRYPNDAIVNILDKLILNECAELADKYLENSPKLTHTEIFKLVECYACQSCECDDWVDTNAYKQYKVIANYAATEAIKLTEEYDASAWYFG